MVLRLSNTFQILRQNTRRLNAVMQRMLVILVSVKEIAGFKGLTQMEIDYRTLKYT